MNRDSRQKLRARARTQAIQVVAWDLRRKGMIWAEVARALGIERDDLLRELGIEP